MRIKNIFVIICVYFFVSGSALCCLAQEKREVKFNWAFWINKGEMAQQVVDFSNPVSVSSGDKLQIMLEPVNEVYLYLFLFGSNKELNLLYPYDPDYYDKHTPGGETIYLPDPNSQYQFDDSKGTERFYLLASSSRLEELESITKDFLRAGDDKDEIKAGVLETIKNLNRKYAKLSSPTQKGVPIAGTIRTRNLPSIENLSATEIEAEEFYSKTLRMQHE